MKLNRIFQDELSEVLQQSSLSGAENFADQSPAFLSPLTRSEHKAVQTLYAKAFRRAVRRARSGGGRGRLTS